MNCAGIYTGWLLAVFTAAVFSSSFSPRVSVGGEIGAARSFLETDGQMKYVFEPTAHVNRDTKVEYALTLDIEFGKYIGIATGMGMRYYGQSTPHTTVLLKDDIFDHDFSSSASVKYFTVPLLVKVGVRRKCFTIFVRAGIVPSIIIKNDVEWDIDGNVIKPFSSRIPPVSFRGTDVPLYGGGEAGYHFGRNTVALVGHYIYGIKSIAYKIPGNVFVRNYGARLVYRREITFSRKNTKADLPKDKESKKVKSE